MRIGLLGASAIAGLIAVGGASVALAQQTPSNLRDLVGARAAGGETQLQARGYRNIRTQTGSDRKWSYWWNSARRECVSVSTYDGRYNAITATLPADCGQSAGSSGSSRPPANSNAPAHLRDLVGVRASSGETQMRARGYRAQQTNTVRGQKWTTWWNDRRDSCVQIATSDGRYSAINTLSRSSCQRTDNRPGYRPPSFTPPPPAYVPPRPGYEYQGDNYYYDPRAMESGTLTLICWGNGDKPAVRAGTDYIWNSRRHRYEPRSYVESGREGFSSGVQVELWGNGGRIHLTGKLIPPIHSGGRDDWWDLTDVNMGPDRITARFRLNGLNRPHVSIDRRTGFLSIDGISKFQGRCDVGNWGDNRNRF